MLQGRTDDSNLGMIGSISLILEQYSVKIMHTHFANSALGLPPSALVKLFSCKLEPQYRKV